MFRATIAGNLTRDAKFGGTSKDDAWLFATVAVTSKVKSTDGSDKLVDGLTTFIEVKAFNGLARNAGPRLLKGMRVNVTGEMREEEKTYNGTTKRVLVILAKDISASLLFPVKDGSASHADRDIEAEMTAEAAALPATSRFLDDDDEE
jgi:single-stranded DNA-binding protein